MNNKETKLNYPSSLNEDSDIESHLEDEVQEDLGKSFESYSSRIKPKSKKRHDKKHHFDDSELFEEQHHKKRDSGKRRHRVKSKDFDTNDDLEMN